MEELLHLFSDLPITVEDAAAYAKQAAIKAKQAAGQAEIDSAFQNWKMRGMKPPQN
jgi:hypothetical protein